MTAQEKIQKHLELAMGSLKWMLKIPQLDFLTIQYHIVLALHLEFSNHEIPLYHFEIIKADESSYTVTVNKSAFIEIKIERKVGNG